jgi:hypothetical protein
MLYVMVTTVWTDKWRQALEDPNKDKDKSASKSGKLPEDDKKRKSEEASKADAQGSKQKKPAIGAAREPARVFFCVRVYVARAQDSKKPRWWLVSCVSLT